MTPIPTEILLLADSGILCVKRILNSVRQDQTVLIVVRRSISGIGRRFVEDEFMMNVSSRQISWLSDVKFIQICVSRASVRHDALRHEGPV